MIDIKPKNVLEQPIFMLTKATTCPYLTGKVEITSQNPGFEIVRKNLPRNIQITHQSLFDNSIEGIKLKSKPVFSVQYHPESNPGPQDSVYLFEEFIKTMKQNAKKKRY